VVSVFISTVDHSVKGLQFDYDIVTQFVYE